MLNRLYSWYGKRVVLGTAGTIAVLLVAGLIVNMFLQEPPNAVEERVPGVAVARISEIGGGDGLSLIGSVEAVDEVHLESEAGGRITSVPVTLGVRVGSGQVIARIENASEYAALLQAEGAYDAAVAAAASSDVSVADTKNGAVSTYRSAFSTVNNVVINTIDDLFANPEGNFPGLRITGGSDTSFLNNERLAYQNILPMWQREAAVLNSADDLQNALTDARNRTTRTLTIVEVFLRRLPQQDMPGAYTQAELNAFQSEFVSAQQSLNATLAAIDSAQEALRRAQIAGTGSVNSSADAQVKQALGTLRAAQANYNKTVIATPISGTVNSLSVKAGDYVSIGSPIAVVANNNALEITTYVNASERNRIAVGDTVSIENDGSGTITNISPGVDPVTKKIEIKLSAEGAALQNGDTVRISVAQSAQTENDQTGDIIIPITALKVETDRIVVFTVTDDNTLVAHPIEEGPLVGNSIIIEAGVTRDMEIVLDARGLNEGDAVNILN